ncbi:sensor histidine kinase [Litorisediminicola beolgyonensis]|uniref:histidine kinase n=1 Tax=Litorisediminicola beolgyonensis TaxID=1173614 RepID=A0ABW3ZMJ3_9RHOB
MKPTERSADIAVDRRRLRDYAKLGHRLFAQRVFLYSFAIFLAGFYYNWVVAAAFYALVWMSELVDAIVYRRILKVTTWTSEIVAARRREVFVITGLSAIIVSGFSVSIAVQQGYEDGHFLALFLLVSASIFAAINNHHFREVIWIRVSIYFAAIFFIPARDVWESRAPITSEIWLHFFTVLFVLGFLVECSRSFLAGYNDYLKNRRALEEEHERTKAAYVAKTRFLATVSHELRTPLTSIRASLDMISSGMLGKVPETAERPLEIATRNAHRLTELVDDLLFLQKAESGTYEYQFETQSLRGFLCEIVERFTPYAQTHGATLTALLPHEDIYARFDRKRLDQVMTNILSNAAKFSKPKGDGQVSIALTRSGKYVRISIEDNGIGIPEAERGRIFEEFQQIDNASTRQFDGTGLGLSISKKIVDAHDGRIDFESEPGVGTIFHVELLEEDEPIGASEEVAASAA